MNTRPDRVLAPDGTELAVRRYAGTASDRPPVLLVHGLGSDAETNWLRAGWVRSLREAGREVVMLDLRGHGSSGAPHDDGRYRVATMVDDVRAVIGQLPVLDAIGYSLGARLLLELVGADGQPQPIRRLVIGGSAGQPQLQRLDLPGIDAVVDGPGPVPADPESARVARVVTALPGNDHRAILALVHGLAADPDAARRTPNPTVPTLVAIGDQDQWHDAAKQWCQRLGQATFLSLPGRTHVSAVPSGLFRAAAVEFLDH